MFSRDSEAKITAAAAEFDAKHGDIHDEIADVADLVGRMLSFLPHTTPAVLIGGLQGLVATMAISFNAKDVPWDEAVGGTKAAFLAYADHAFDLAFEGLKAYHEQEAKKAS